MKQFFPWKLSWNWSHISISSLSHSTCYSIIPTYTYIYYTYLHVTLLHLPKQISITPTYTLLFYTYLHRYLLHLPTCYSIAPTYKDIYYTYLHVTLLHLPTKISIALSMFKVALIIRSWCYTKCISIELGDMLCWNKAICLV